MGQAPVGWSGLGGGGLGLTLLSALSGLSPGKQRLSMMEWWHLEDVL